MKLKNLCKSPITFVFDSCIYDDLGYNMLKCYVELRKSILTNINLSELSINQVSEIYPLAIRDGIVEYRIGIQNGFSRYIYLKFISEEYFLNVIPNTLSYIYSVIIS